MLKLYLQAGIGLLLLVLTATTATANPAELIVLLPSSADPVAVVDQIVQGSPTLPYGLATGSPIAARLVLSERPQGRTAQWIQANPESDLATLYRYIVLEYPAPTDIGAVQTALEIGGELPSVEPNIYFELSSPVIPNDPMFGTLLGDIAFSQWALHLMKFPEAWAWAKGHAQVGVVDTGIQPAHPEVAAYLGSPLQWQGGNFRSHRSFNNSRSTSPQPNGRCNVDEVEPGDVWAGHGTHVAGLVGARANNGSGVAGTCWNCSLQIGKAFEDAASATAEISRAGDAGYALISEGVQVLNFSFGVGRAEYPSCTTSPEIWMCALLRFFAQRQVVIAASSGNDRTVVDFPASEPGIIAVGGVERTLTPPYFERWEESVCPYPNGAECGSNFGSTLDLVAPAKSVVSTLYKDWIHNATVGCGDKEGIGTMAGIPGTAGDGLGICTGTSMSAPLIAGLAGIVRSVNPRLTHLEVADVLTSTATDAANRTDFLGYGLPQADAAVLRALGVTNGKPIENRLTPLFSLKSLANQVHYYTPAPQEAAALTFDNEDPFDTFGPVVSGYSLPGGCTVSPCPSNIPRASVYLFTSDRAPFVGSPVLKPVYRLRYDPARVIECAGNIPPSASSRRFAYAGTTSEINFFKNNAVDSLGIGYDNDGLLGWIYPWCEPNATCRPAGTTALYRLYNLAKDDWAIMTEAERPAYESSGYAVDTNIFPGLGFVYTNTDADADLLVDGFERLIGSNAAVADTDCDNIVDGLEAWTYNSSGAPATHGYGDPLDGPCFAFFQDGFETGNTSRWSLTSTGPGEEIGF